MNENISEYKFNIFNIIILIKRRESKMDERLFCGFYPISESLIFNLKHYI